MTKFRVALFSLVGLLVATGVAAPPAGAAVGVPYTVAATIPVGNSPGEIAVTPDGSRAYVSNYDSGSVSVIDTISNSVVTTISVGRAPTGVAVSPDGSTVYVTNFLDSGMRVIDTSTNTVSATYQVGAYPRAVVVRPDGRRVYVVNQIDSTVSEIVTDPTDTDVGTVVNTIPVGFGPVAITLNSSGSTAYVVGGMTMTVVDLTMGSVAATVSLGDFPDDVAISADGSTVFTTGAQGSSVIRVNTSSLAKTTVPLGFYVRGLAANGSRLFMAGTDTTTNANAVKVLDTATATVIDTVPVGATPFGIAVIADASRVLVTNRDGKSVSAVIASGVVSAPAAPTGLVATAGEGSASIAFTPGADGGAAITKYQFSLDGGLSWNDANGTTSPLVLPGFVNYTTYSIKLRAVNSAGNGAPSSSVSTMPAYAAPVQAAPTVGGARRSILASWSLLPVNAQHDRIKLYRAAAYLAGTNTKVRTCMGAATETSCEMKGLTIGTAYDVRVEAVHLAGTGPSKTLRRSLLSASRSITLQ